MAIAGFGLWFGLVDGAAPVAMTLVPAVLATVANWGFDIGVLWASFHAFGDSPPGAVLVMGYYVWTLENVLPVPGGIGGVQRPQPDVRC